MPHHDVHRGLVLSIAVMVAAGLAAADSAEVQCPISSVEVYCQPRVDSTEPRNSVSCSSDYFIFASASYDLVIGRLEASAPSPPFYGGGAGTITVDEYVVVGLDPGSSIQLMAHFRLTGNYSTLRDYCCYGSASGSIRQGPNVASCYFSGYPSSSFDHTLSIPIETTAGSAFEIRLQAGADGIEGGSGSITGQLAFTNLPPGSSVVSCQGFRQDGPTPVIPSTWGALKTRYR